MFPSKDICLCAVSAAIGAIIVLLVCTLWCAVKNLVVVASEVGNEFKNLKIKGKTIMELSSVFLYVV